MDRRVELKEALEECLREGGDLAAEARSARLDPAHLVEEGLEAEAEILADVDAPWRALESARAKAREFSLLPRSERLLAYLARISRLSFSSFPSTLGLLSLIAGPAVIVLSPFTSPQAPGPRILSTGVGAFLCIYGASLWLRGRRIAGARRADEALRAARVGYKRALRETGAANWVRQRINAALRRSYETKLSYGNRVGLAEVDNDRREVSTRTKERLLGMIEDKRMPGGAIGLSGSRGAGKSTLMGSICRSTKAKEEGGRKVLGVVVDAPVEYDAREFVLHLYAKVCSEVLGVEKVERLRGRTRLGGPSSLWANVFLDRGIAIGLCVILVSFAYFEFSLLGVDLGSASRPLVAAVGIVIGFSIFVPAVRRNAQLRRRRQAASVLAASSKEEVDDLGTAAEDLQEIWFQQSFSSGWSGAIKLPVGFEGEVSSSTELAKRQMSFPEVVDNFKRFLRQISSTRQVRIGIDELDKMDDEVARRFLNEIKVVFRVPNCFFLISVSEDAMSAFERRGLPFRDVFDSSFDDVVKVPSLGVEGSKALLDRRIIGLPFPFVCLVHCTSGGLPRDLVRAARDVVEQERGTPLSEVATALVEEALRSKVDAARVASRRFDSPRHVTALATWLEELLATGADVAGLVKLCQRFKSRFLARLAALPPEPDLREERRELESMAMQLVTFAYLTTTTMQLFERFDDASYVDYAAGPEPDTEEDAGEGWAGELRDETLPPVDRLARVFQAFSGDIDTAWRRLSALRKELGLDAVAFPVARRRRSWRLRAAVGAPA